MQIQIAVQAINVAFKQEFSALSNLIRRTEKV